MAGGIDVYHFKDPGCNLALGHGFTSASFVGTESFDRTLWLSQGPLFPLIFGVFASIFGCNVDSNNMFNLLVSALLCFEIVVLLPKDVDGGLQLVFVVALALLLPTGGYQWPADRPDHLALVFILALPIIQSRFRNTQATFLFSFLVAGMTLLISPYYGFVGTALALTLAYNGSALSFQKLAKLLCQGVAVSGIPMFATILAYLLLDSSSLGRFVRHTKIIFSDVSFPEKLKHAIFLPAYLLSWERLNGCLPLPLSCWFLRVSLVGGVAPDSFHFLRCYVFFCWPHLRYFRGKGIISPP